MTPSTEYQYLPYWLPRHEYFRFTRFQLRIFDLIAWCDTGGLRWQNHRIAATRGCSIRTVQRALALAHSLALITVHGPMGKFRRIHWVVYQTPQDWHKAWFHRLAYRSRFICHPYSSCIANYSNISSTAALYSRLPTTPRAVAGPISDPRGSEPPACGSVAEPPRIVRTRTERRLIVHYLRSCRRVGLSPSKALLRAQDLLDRYRAPAL